MLKILWFCNIEFTEGPMKSTGTWLVGMMHALLASNKVQLYNITDGQVDTITKRDYRNLQQWILPKEKLNSKGLPSAKTLTFIQGLEADIKPKLIHIWGTENYWGILKTENILQTNTLLDMQGVMNSIPRVFYAGMSNAELLACIGLKEVLLPKRMMCFQKKHFQKKAIRESKIIKSFNNISTQSAFVEAYISAQNSKANIFSTGIILRKEFYQTPPWQGKENSNPVIFTSSSGAVSYKGLHILFRAIALLKKKYPDIQLHIAGKIEQSKLRQDGYTRWILKEAAKLKILNNIKWLGALDANGIIEQFHVSSVVVVPSYVETYCLAFAEAMMVGVPTVASYAGAMPELAKHEESTLFFPVGDHTSCAWQIQRLLEDKKLVELISKNARTLAFKRNDPQTIVAQQLKIYEACVG